MDTTDAHTDPFLGKRIRGYRLEQLLSSGNATAVYRARTEEIWQLPELIVTLLLVPEHLSLRAKEHFVARFENTAQRMVSLRHPFLFPLYGYGQQEGMYYLLAPIIQGETLALHMQKHKRFTPAEILPIFRPIAATLSHVHQEGFVYQFLQPANILLMNSTNVQLTDLGLPQLLCLRGLEEEPTPYNYLTNFAGAFMGAPHYLAPEVVKRGEASPRSDVYSLGILLYEMLSGQPPFSGNDYLTIAQKHVREPLPSFHDAAPDLPIALELIINRALHRTPDQRFQSPDEFVAAYAHMLDERLRGPRFFDMVQLADKIRALPMPSPTPPSKLPEPEKNEQEIQFVEQDEIPPAQYIDIPLPQPQKDKLELPNQAGTTKKGPVTAPLNSKDLEISDAARQEMERERDKPLTPHEQAPEPAHNEVLEMALQLQQMKERLQARAHKQMLESEGQDATNILDTPIPPSLTE